MVSKNLKIVMGIMFSLVFVFGCLGSGSENNQVVEAPAVQAETVQASAYQNTEWIQSYTKYCQIIGPELTSVGNAADKSDFESMVYYGQKLESDTAAAIQESQKYNVSPSYQAAKQNWEIALLYYQRTGACLKTVGTEKGSNPKNITDAISYCESGTEYLKQCQKNL